MALLIVPSMYHFDWFLPVLELLNYAIWLLMIPNLAVSIFNI